MQVTDHDPATQSNYWDIFTEHVDIVWKVDFDTRTVSGSIDHRLSVERDDVSEVMSVLFSTFPVPFYD
jgi:leukotriene-A4 hydrolase